MAEEKQDPDIKSWMIKVERRLSRLEGKVNVILIILGGLLGLLAAIISKI